MKHLILFAILVIGCQLLEAQSPAQRAFDTAMSVTNEQPENYLAPIRLLHTIKADTADRAGMGTWYQAMMTYYSFIGDYKKLLFYSDARFGEEAKKEKVNYDTAFVRQHHFIDAASYITEQARHQQVVMINEAHHLPYHRALLMEMLRSFYQSGYHTLAIETLDDSLINQKPYPDYHTGYYSREPLFGELIREAKSLGFKLAGYEPKEECDHKSTAPNYCNSFRDSLMARNLESLLGNQSGQKLLVFAGYDHVHEGNSNGWKKMAQYFKQFTGIDPLTIDQTRQVEHLYPQLDEKEFISVNTLLHITGPVVAVKDDRPWHGKFVDISVIFPQYLKQGNHPSFYSIGGMRKPYGLQYLHLKPKQFVQAFYANELPGNRIPADQLVVEKADDKLYLRRGKYTLSIKDNEGKTIKELMIVVK
ncbi:hypothetical protein C8P68_10114 [Mucilaginibacter yixingensis]|uniref:Uncharacterized protein n=1 Tax=Mucilaginibacter yixingensis TaxID=1295612 RepID=A0A2T5JEC7_9SPHI|nr:hypothetical protein [Mucilaginibacter yixingensis]PTR00787.1 hypothetical protein C8P68_10114 [Mucilaginibacter yixingensis]